MSFPILLYTHHLCGQQNAFDFKRTHSHTYASTGSFCLKRHLKAVEYEGFSELASTGSFCL